MPHLAARFFGKIKSAITPFLCNYTESDCPALLKMCALEPTGDKIFIVSARQIRSIACTIQNFL